jgi:serine/threonine protein kinase
MPSDVAVDPDGNVFVADMANQRIQKFTNDGTFITKWGEKGYIDGGEFNGPIGVAVDLDGNLYVADRTNYRIQKFTNNGIFINKWGKEGIYDGQFKGLSDIEVDSEGYIYVTDDINDRIQKFTSDGTFITKWGEKGDGERQFNSPSGVAIDADGNIYVVDSNNNRIQKFRSSIPLTSQPTDFNLLLLIGFILLVGLGAGLLVKNRNKKIQSPIQMKNEGRSQKKTDMHESLPSQTPILQDIVPSFPRELLTRYNPIELVGEGGFAKVFKVKRISDGQVVAVKIPRIDEKTSSILMNEVAAWYHLNHPNIIKLYNSNLLPILHIEMEYVEGIEVNGKRTRDLDGLQKPISQEQTLKIISDISRGLQYAHEKGIYHHDLKPLNVLITAGFVPKIADFGLSEISSHSSIMADKGYSPMYAAPEQLDSEKYGNPDQRTDLYHLGLIFYELLTGKLPYDGSSHVVIISKILSPEIAPAKLASVNPDLAIYDPIMAKLIAKRMEDRYQTVSEFKDALQSVYSLNKERSELLEDLKITKASLKTSSTTGDIQRLTREAIRKSIRIALLHAQLNDRVELITALNEIRLLTSHHREELDTAIDQVQYMIAEDLPLGKEWIDQLRILLGKIEMQG